MIINENINPLVQKALYSKIDALNRLRLGKDESFFISNENLEPSDNTNPVEQHLFRNCFAKVSAAIDKNTEGEDIVAKQPISLSSYFEIGSETTTQSTNPLTFRKSFAESKDNIFRGHTGITGISVSQLSFFTKKITINWTCPDPIDFEERVQPIFLRHGQYIAVEFGWGIDETSIKIPPLSISEMEDLIDGVRERQLLSAGNYYCDVGLVTNYTYKLESYGGYTGTIDVITRGQNILNQTTQESEERPSEIPIARVVSELREQSKAEVEDTESNVTDATKELDELQVNSTTFNSVIRNLDKVLDEYFGPRRVRKDGVYGRVDNPNYKSEVIEFPLDESYMEYKQKPEDEKFRKLLVKSGRLDYRFKNGAMYFNVQKIGSGSPNTPDSMRKNYLMSWGWFEDHILNSFFNITVSGGKSLQQIRSTIIDDNGIERPTKCKTTKELYSYGLDSVMLPGKTLPLVKSPIPEDKNTLEDYPIKQRVDMSRVKYMYKTIDNLFNSFEDDEGEGIIRNMVFPIEMYQKHFQTISSVRQGMQSFWAEVTNTYGGYWNFSVMQDDDNTGKIGVVDFTLPKPAEKKDNSLLENQSTREDFINNTLTKDKIFTFSLFSKNTIVKDFSLDVKLTSKAATLVNYANNTNILDSVNNPTDAKDLGLLAFSLLFKADKVEKSIENKKGKDKNKPNSVVKDLLFPTQRDLDGDGTPDGKGLGTDASVYSDDEAIRPLLNDNGITFTTIKDIQEDQKEIEQKIEKERISQQVTNGYARDASLSSYIKQRLNYIINFSLHKGDDSALQRSKPIVPIEISLTIDGTAGIRPGDLFRVDYLPKAYRDFAYFFVSDVGHTMATSGWETTITGLMKVDTAKMIKEGFILEKPKRKLEFEKYEEYRKELEELSIAVSRVNLNARQLAIAQRLAGTETPPAVEAFLDKVGDGFSY